MSRNNSRGKEKKIKIFFLKSEATLWVLLDSITRANIKIMGIPEVKKEKRIGRLFKEIIAGNVPNLGK